MCESANCDNKNVKANVNNLLYYLVLLVLLINYIVFKVIIINTY